MTIIIADTARIHHATKAKAEKLADLLAAEYPAIQLEAEYNEDASQVVGFFSVYTDEEGEETTLTNTKKVPELADIFAACEDNDLDPELGADDEPEGAGGTVVPQEYRVQYREQSSTGQSCGDWLAEQLTADTHGADGFSTADFQQVLDNNDVDQTAKWAKLPESGQNGWIGRWRMNGRQVLEKIVALRGVYVDTIGTQHAPDPEWLATKRARHAKWIAKQEKLAEAHGKGE